MPTSLMPRSPFPVREPSGHLWLDVLVDVLGLLVLGQASRPELAPDAGFPEPAPFGLWEVRVEVVDPDGTVAQPLRHPLRLARVLRPDAGRQAVAGVVADPDGLVLGGERL